MENKEEFSAEKNHYRSYIIYCFDFSMYIYYTEICCPENKGCRFFNGKYSA